MIRVLLADDQELVRAGIRLVLRHAEDIEVVAETSGGADVVALALRHKVDVALLDIQMAAVDGLTAAERMAARAPSVRVVMLTTFGEDEYVRRALRAGAVGFLLKDSTPDELIGAVRLAAAGKHVVSPEITGKLIDGYLGSGTPQADPHRERLSVLTQRELDILILLGTGASNAEIGQRMFLGEGTVKAHVSRILTKLGCANRVQAAVLAHEAGLLSDS
ncbi:response regulator [Longispora urticae]